jgi:hypothetical protein
MNGSSAGTQGWFSCMPLSKRRMGIPGPDPENPRAGSPYYLAVKLRQAGDHIGYRSILEWDDSAESWMLLVLDNKRNIVGLTIGRTQAAAERKMNDLFDAKGLGIYNRKYAEIA